VNIVLPSGAQVRVDTFSPGMAFGEMAMLEGGTRTADIIADTEVSCYVMDLSKFDAVSRDYPSIKIKFQHNMLKKISQNLRKANQELTALA
ncbi:Crp/Fnr family transcriptional regulator, partial [Candidatus Riflebacteria bacterium]